ncbi:PREDICTED: TATA box-binding protein-associated factor RNA polymerase I subunit D [Chinchilla lanigera]|uniref:TATA box-binding protein-associated factor RNA polymerase I subunit D n=1 Tax=Chinchilla lanigera TaxID=34839 RepID=A0A8C2YT63_CHILA|nr:PREDICTED: TATA box-binding protein-associated factor RNA polymerase I subunit D [Chinchilla lanigera]
MDKSVMDPVTCMTSDTAVEIENQSDSSSSGSSLFKTQCVPLPKRTQRNPVKKFVHNVHKPESVQTDSSSDSSIEPRPLTLKAIFERFKKKKKRKKRKYKPKLTPRGRPKGRRNTRRSQIDKKQIKDKGPKFPILQSEDGRKPLPWRKILSFEQAVARGFFNYIEKLKYEHHLKESLKQMNVSEDLEKEDFDSRRYKYMDDDGSISPIEESEAEERTTHLEHDECDIKLVEESCFIKCSEFPNKMNVYLRENNKEAALTIQKVSKARNTGQRAERFEKETNL